MQQQQPGGATPDGGNASLRDLILPVYMSAFLVATATGAMNTFVPLFLRSLGASVGMTASVIGIGSLGVLVFDLPSGYLTARLGERRVMIISGIIMAVATLITGSSAGLGLAAVGLFLWNASVSLWFVGRLSYMRRVLRADVRGRGLATAGGVMRIGAFCGPVLGGFLAEGVGYRFVFYGGSVMAAASMVLFLIFDRSHIAGSAHAESPSGASRPGVSLSAFRDVFVEKRRAFLTAGLSMVMLTLLRAGRSLILPLWGERIGLDASSIGLVIGLGSAVDTAMFVPAGMISDRFGRRWSAIICLVVLSGGIAAVPLAGTFVTFAVVSMIAGVGNGMGSGINMTLSADFAGGSEPGVFLGLWRMISDLGKAAAPFVVGVVAQLVALGPSAWVVAALGFAAAAYHARFVEETLVRTPASR